MKVLAIRGATTVTSNNKEEILKENISKINTFINYTILWDRIQEIQNKKK